MVRIPHTLDWIEHVTPAMAGNALQLLFDFYASRALKRPIIKGMPASISFEPTTSCNLRCPECPSGLRSFSRPTGNLDLQLFDSTLNQLEKELSYLTLYFQGEPFLHQGIYEIIANARDRGIYVATSTNAHYLNEENCEKIIRSGLNKLIVSIDGATQETYEQYRVGGKLESVLEGTKELIRLKKHFSQGSPEIVFQFLVVKQNEHEIGQIKKMANEMGVDQVVFKTAQVYDYEKGSPFIPENEKYSRYTKKEEGYKIKNKLYNHCWRMWQGSVITWDGKVVPCCFDKDGEHVLGDLKEQSFRDIWFGEKYNAFRKTLLTNRKSIDICRNCTEGTRVWI